ncbi:hypothetical protein [Tepidibacillus sp. HK-1]|uniref:hypothetical protein n=1 Tax=Tepidibacillus sp. HK-1 TaxID=1883407 RepID=UPI000852FA97|nr:hypothetical protein [Tepidibacillus sp. HK-1]GBF12626.1 hypothetical protein HK1_02693 [Tepidibacillus sp. HK-1]
MEFKMRFKTKKLIFILSIIFVLFMASVASAELQAVFELGSVTTTYIGDAEGTNPYTGVYYYYWRHETIKGDADQAKTAYFSKVKVDHGTTSPANSADFGVYSIVDSVYPTEKTYLYFYSDPVTLAQEAAISYTAEVQNLYTELVVYASEDGIDGPTYSAHYDRFAYQP